jgi:hypothetical protein
MNKERRKAGRLKRGGFSLIRKPGLAGSSIWKVSFPVFLLS